MDGADASQRKSLEESAEQIPVERAVAVATQEPFPPTTLDFDSSDDDDSDILTQTIADDLALMMME